MASLKRQFRSRNTPRSSRKVRVTAYLSKLCTTKSNSINRTRLTAKSRPNENRFGRFQEMAAYPHFSWRHRTCLDRLRPDSAPRLRQLRRQDLRLRELVGQLGTDCSRSARSVCRHQHKELAPAYAHFAHDRLSDFRP